MASGRHDGKNGEGIQKYEWAVMKPEYDSLKAEILKYEKQRCLLEDTQRLLEHVHDDIARKNGSDEVVELQTIVEGLLKKNIPYLERLPTRYEFLMNDSGIEIINTTFQTSSKTLFRRQAKLVSLFQNAKKTLEVRYTNTAMYSPDAEVPSEYRYKVREGDHWKWFCGDVDKLTQEPRSREEEEEKEHKRARIEGGDASLTDDARGVRLVQLLNELKLLL